MNFDQANELILCLQLIECSAVAIHPSLSDNLLELLPKLNLLLKHPLKAVSKYEIIRNVLTNHLNYNSVFFFVMV